MNIRLLSLLLTVLLLLTACRDREDNSTDPSAQLPPTARYTVEHVALPDDIRLQNCMTDGGDRLYLSIMTPVESHPYRLWQYSLADGSSSFADLPGDPDRLAISSQGILTGKAVYEQGAWDAVDYTLTASSDGQELWSQSLLRLMEVNPDQPVSLADFNGQWVVGCESTLILLDREGNLQQTETLPGKLRCFLPEENLLRIVGDGWYRELDLAGKLHTNEAWENAVKGTAELLYPAPGYGFCYANDNSLMLCQVQSGQHSPLLNWAECGLTFADIKEILFRSADELYILGQLRAEYTTALLKLTRAGEEESGRTEIHITYSETGRQNVPLAASLFNAAQEEYTVVCTEYSTANPGQDYAALADSLDAMILDGTAGDIIELDNPNALYKYTRKGLFADLYSLGMESITADNLFGCVKNALEIDGKLYALPQVFQLDTLSARTASLPAGQWNLDALLNLAEGLPGDQRLFAYAKSGTAMHNLLKNSVLSQCIDLTAGSASFDSPTFLRYLSLLSSLPAQAEVRDIAGNPYARNEVLFYQHYIQNYSTFSKMTHVFTAPEETAIVGYPSIDGGSAQLHANKYYAISADSQVMEGAKAFLEFFLSAEAVYDPMRGMREIPSLKSTARCYDEEELQLYHYFPIDDPGRISTSFKQQDPDPTVMEVKADEALLEQAWTFFDASPVMPFVPQDIIDIVDEELTTFFGGGQSAENTARYIQNRVSTYLSEQS